MNNLSVEQLLILREILCEYIDKDNYLSDEVREIMRVLSEEDTIAKKPENFLDKDFLANVFIS